MRVRGTKSGYQFELSFYSPADGTSFWGLILVDITTDLAYIISRVTLGKHIIHGLLVKFGMPIFYVAGLGKGLTHGSCYPLTDGRFY